MRLTYSLVQVAQAMMDDPAGRHWGYDLSKKCGLRSGVLYPILQRMLAADLVTDGWETGDEINGRRPPRRYYELTADGVDVLTEVLDRARRESRFRALNLGYAS